MQLQSSGLYQGPFEFWWLCWIWRILPPDALTLLDPLVKWGSSNERLVIGSYLPSPQEVEQDPPFERPIANVAYIFPHWWHPFGWSLAFGVAMLQTRWWSNPSYCLTQRFVFLRSFNSPYDNLCLDAFFHMLDLSSKFPLKIFLLSVP